MINQGPMFVVSPLSTGAISGRYSGLRSRHLPQSARDADGSSLEKKLKEECVNIQSKPEGRTKVCRTALVGSLPGSQILDCVS
jgi:hypothetical protein